jgi:hypothetical protein
VEFGWDFLILGVYPLKAAFIVLHGVIDPETHVMLGIRLVNPGGPTDVARTRHPFRLQA